MEYEIQWWGGNQEEWKDQVSSHCLITVFLVLTKCLHWNNPAMHWTLCKWVSVACLAYWSCSSVGVACHCLNQQFACLISLSVVLRSFLCVFLIFLCYNCVNESLFYRSWNSQVVPVSSPLEMVWKGLAIVFLIVHRSLWMAKEGDFSCLRRWL